MHSSDIAFKPNDDGWGYTKQYASGWDRIFAKKDEAPPAAEKPAPVAAQDTKLTKQQTALAAAHECGALSDELFALAKSELESKSASS